MYISLSLRKTCVCVCAKFDYFFAIRAQHPFIQHLLDWKVLNNVLAKEGEGTPLAIEDECYNPMLALSFV